jgi:hypothetical protein
MTVPKQYNPRMSIEEMVEEIVRRLAREGKKGEAQYGRR